MKTFRIIVEVHDGEHGHGIGKSHNVRGQEMTATLQRMLDALKQAHPDVSDFYEIISR